MRLTPGAHGPYSASCAQCRRPVALIYEYRTVRFRGSRLSVPNVLVGVCSECGDAVSIPRESIPQLREAGGWK